MMKFNLGCSVTVSDCHQLDFSQATSTLGVVRVEGMLSGSPITHNYFDIGSDIRVTPQS